MRSIEGPASIRLALILSFGALVACSDAGAPDVGGADALVLRDAVAVDAVADATPTDAGSHDAVEPDAAPDAETLDAAGLDAGGFDAQPSDAGARVTLSVSTSTGGRVFSDPPGIDCDVSGTSCASDFALDTTCTLTASAAAGFIFDVWGGDCNGGAAVATVRLDAPKRCDARFIGLGGAIRLIPPPLSVTPNETEDDVQILLFRERTAHRLGAPLPFDTLVAETVSRSAQLTPGVLPEGTVVDVYFLHFDPIGTTRTIRRAASIVFPDEILAVAHQTATLYGADSLVGLTGTVAYPQSGHAERGLELTPEDAFTIGGDRRTLTIDFATSSSSDQMRIYTRPRGTPSVNLGSATASFVAPPASVRLGLAESSTVVRIFLERAGMALAQPVDVDVTSPGSYASVGSLTPATLSAGAVVTSYFVHLDPVGGALFSPSVAVLFIGPLRGVIVSAGSLDTSDLLLGASATEYPAPGAEATRGIDLGADEVVVGSDLRSIRFRLSATTGSDQARVIIE